MFRAARATLWIPVGILVLLLLPSGSALSQSNQRGVFVANNGNLEGSVTAFRLDPGGTLAFVNRIITGTRPTTSDPCLGCNPYEISITPDGRYLATGHASSNDPTEQISVFEIAADGSIAQVGAFPVPGTPMDVVWVGNTTLATLRTDPSPDKVVIYRFNPIGPALTELDVEDVGTFCSYLAVDPNREYLYVNDSGSGRLIRAFRIGDDGTLTLVDSEPTGSYYGLELAFTNDGTKMYAAGGITYVVLGYQVAPDGTLSPMAGSPFPQAGTSPSNLCSTPDDHYLLVGHGTDATLRSAAIDPITGGLTYTGFLFDVGLQGTLGDVNALDEFVFVTDNSSATDGVMGIYSFLLNGDGSFTQNGPYQSTSGIAPRSIAVWKPLGSSGVGEEAGSRVSAQVLPNPFRGTTRITYAMPAAGPVTVELLDVSGRVARRLVDETQTAGEHALSWDGTDGAGRALPAGVYFARIRTGSAESSVRVIVLR